MVGHIVHHPPENEVPAIPDAATPSVATPGVGTLGVETGGRPVSLIKALLSAKGNAAACIWTEPLWGIPYHLFAPFASVYMLALGASEFDIGVIATLSLALQVVTSLVGGPITDKMGRKNATVVFDILSWSVPAALWALAHDRTWFFAAAVFNSLLRITVTSWTCLFTEDAPPDRLVHYWALVNVAGILVGLVSPVVGLFIERWSLVPTMRGIYAFTFVSMTVKFIILFFASTETRVGVERLREVKHKPFWSLFRDYPAIVRMAMRNRHTVAGIGVMAVITVYHTVRSAFFAVLLTEGLGFSAAEIGWFPALRSVVMVIFLFFVLPHLNHAKQFRAIRIGIAVTIVGTVVLVFAPARNYPLVILSTLLEAAGAAVLAPFLETMIYRVIDAKERARVLSVANVLMLAVASPFGWIAGALSEQLTVLPFVLLIVVLGVGLLLSRVTEGTTGATDTGATDPTTR